MPDTLPIRIAQSNHPTLIARRRSAGIGGDDRGFDVEFVGRAGFALADAFDLGRVEGIELPPARALLLGTDLLGAREF